MTSPSSSGNGSQEETKEQAKTEPLVRPADVLAGALASTLAAIAGGHLGAVGSIVGAFIASAISATALPFFRVTLRSGEKRIYNLAVKPSSADGEDGAASRPDGDDELPAERTQVDGWSAIDGTEADLPTDSDAIVTGIPGEHRSDLRKRRIATIAIVTVGMAVIAFGIIFILQGISGRALSPGTGQMQGHSVTVASSSARTIPATAESVPQPTASAETTTTASSPLSPVQSETPMSPSANPSASSAVPTTPASTSAVPSHEPTPPPAKPSDAQPNNP